MYVKLFNQILDSSIADNRKLRHFFTDLLLCSDPDGNVIMTPTAISKRIRADMEEVEWGLAELQKPDPMSLTKEHQGKRIIPLDGHGYGWKILNYEMYRDFKTAKQLREATAERVRRYRQKKDKSKSRAVRGVSGKYLRDEQRFVKADGDGNDELADKIAAGEA